MMMVVVVVVVVVGVSLSVCCVPRPNLRTERLKKPKIGTIETHHITRVTREHIYIFRGQKVKD